MEIIKYPDGSSYAVVDDSDKDINFRVNSYEDLWHLNQAVDAFYSYWGFMPVVRINWLIDAQADKRDAPNKSAGLKLVMNLLKSMPVERFHIFHPHNSIAVEMALDNVVIESNTSFFIQVMESISNLGFYDSTDEWVNHFVVMFPDAGAFKWGQELLTKVGWEGESYSANKQRPQGDGKQKLKQFIDRQDFGGKDILIVDDLSIYGGTFKGLATLLKERNCGKLFLAVSHMTVQDIGNDPVTNYFDHVYTTNSKFDNYQTWDRSEIGTQPKNLTVLEMF